MPMQLPEAVRERVKSSVTSSNMVMPLPIDTNMPHALQRGATASVVQEKITSWLDSEQGKEWQQERKELFGTDDKNSEADVVP